MEIEQEPQQVLPNQHVHSQDLVQSTSLQHTPPVDPGAEHLFIHSTGTDIPSLSAPKELTPAGDRRRHSSYLQRTPTGDTGDIIHQHIAHLEAIHGDRVPLYNSLIQWIALSWTGLPHPFNVKIGFAGQVGNSGPHTLTPLGRRGQGLGHNHHMRDVDLLKPVGVPWFHRFQTNIMELEDTSWLLNDWERLMGSGADKPCRSWSLFKHQWSTDDLKVVRGLVPAGTKPRNEVDVVTVLFTLFEF
ncbi:hypothetical protein LWI28_013635 [Acer negundo]|uniref:Uncharacterized protein n=1 Tax=Acer negundo TaxID=4023 RepID=A0AAD5IVE8_ACENE|nr:hypothetical protein LWI28_013635 [Acer negundo]